jgi:ankyrin repeat protein
MTIIDLPLELIDLICNFIPISDLDDLYSFTTNHLLKNLNEKRMEKYWRKIGIFELVKLGKINGVKFLIDSVSKSAEIIKISKIGSVEFSINSETNSTEIFKMSKVSDAWRENANMKPRDYKLIMLASKHGHLDILKYLFEHVFSKKVENPGKIDKNMLYSIALEKACKYNHFNVVKYLVELGTNVEELFGSNNIIHACENGNLELVKYLVENGIDIHVYNEYPAFVAADRGHFDIVKYLIGKGVNIHAIKNDCLVCGYTKDHLEMREYMLSFGADITCNNYAVLKAVIKLDDFEKVKSVFQMIVEKTREKGENIDKSALGNCMKIACENGNLDIIQFFVSNGISTKNCIRTARKSEQLHVVEYLENLNNEKTRGKPNKETWKNRENI